MVYLMDYMKQGHRKKMASASGRKDVVPRGGNSNPFDDFVVDITKKSAAAQLAIGGASGWVAGYLFVKVGKLAAASVGTTIILIQVARYKGYLKITDEKNVKNKLKNFGRTLGDKAKEGLDAVGDSFSSPAEADRRQFMRTLSRIFKQNMFLCGGFAGGFFLGISF